MTVFSETLKKASYELEENKIEKMFSYYKLLTSANSKFNLTAITDESEAALGHFYDSIFCAGLIPQSAQVLDVGTGAGFPGIPLKIARPDIDITLMDSTAKKNGFCQRGCRKARNRRQSDMHARRGSRQGPFARNFRCLRIPRGRLPAAAERALPALCPSRRDISGV